MRIRVTIIIIKKSLQLVRKGGLIVIDNVLWYGKVADDKINDNRTQKIREFNTKLAQDDRIDLSIISMGDGLTLAMKKDYSNPIKY